MPGGCIQCIGTNRIETVKVNSSLNAAYSIVEVVLNGDLNGDRRETHGVQAKCKEM